MTSYYKVMKVVEKFISINGEGKRAGELAVFVRFKDCNLRCSYCDTIWALEPNCPFQEETPEAITKYILNTKIKDVTLTGGEPLIQPDIKRLIELILNSNKEIRIEIETNGAVSLKDFRVEDSSRLSFTMDYKLPSSGFEHSMKLDNFQYLTEKDSVKFVAGSLEDLKKAKQIIEKYELIQKGISIFISPVFGKIELTKIVDFIKGNNLNDVRMQIQLHKVIWHPDTRGV